MQVQELSVSLLGKKENETKQKDCEVNACPLLVSYTVNKGAYHYDIACNITLYTCGVPLNMCSADYTVNLAR